MVKAFMNDNCAIVSSAKLSFSNQSGEGKGMNAPNVKMHPAAQPHHLEAPLPRKSRKCEILHNRNRQVLSATSGKAGGLTEVERLKAARPFGRLFPRPCQHSDRHCPTPLFNIRNPQRFHVVAAAFSPAPARRLDSGLRPRLALCKRNQRSPERLPEPSNSASLPGTAGRFPDLLTSSSGF